METFTFFDAVSHDTLELKVNVVFRRPRLVKRRCLRSFGRRVVMVLHPQHVPQYGFEHFADYGKAECTGCGRTHVILGSHGFVPGADT